VLYWVLQTELQTTDELKCSAAETVISNLPSLVTSNDSSAFVSYEAQLAAEYKATEVDPTDETWQEFQQRLFREHADKTYTGAVSYYTPSL